MALIKCPECGREISDKASACPGCGCPVEKKESGQPVVEAREEFVPEIEVQKKVDLNERYRKNEQFPKTTQAKTQKREQEKFECHKCGMMIPVGSHKCDYCGFSYPDENYMVGKDAYSGVFSNKYTYIEKEKKKRKNRKMWIVIIVIVLFLIGMFSGEDDESDMQTTSANESAPEVTQESFEEKAKYSSEQQNTTGEDAAEEIETRTESSEEAIILPEETKEEFIASCQQISYKALLRNPENYIGQRIVITAKIQQVLQGGLFDDGQYYRVQTDNDGYDWYLDDEYFMYDSRIDDETKLLEDDILVIYAEFAGLETVTRALTSTKEEVPAINAYYVEIIGE